MADDKQRLLAGEPYLAGAQDLVADRRRARLLTERLNATGAAEPEQRQAILTELLAGLGEQTEILSPFACDYGYQISVGARTFINFGAVILDSAPVSIGDDVQIGPGVQLVTPTHPLHAAERRTGVEWGTPITIENDAWLATGVIVCPGVTIGAGCVVGAGAVVTKDCEPNAVYCGVPARLARRL